MFTEEAEVKALILKGLIICVVCNFFIDAPLMPISGCVRALGIQSKAAIVNIVTYYIVSIPLAWVFAFVVNGLGIVGLWLGAYVGVAL